MNRLALFFVMLSVFAISISANEQWREISTRNFTIIGDADSAKLVEVANRFESLHTRIQNSFEKTKLRVPFETNIIVFGSNSKIPASEFVSGDDVNYASISLGKNSDEAFQQISRNYVDFVVSNNLGRRNIPPWLFSAFCGYFSEVRDSQDFLSSRQNLLIPFDIILETDHFTFQNQNEERKALFNAQSQVLFEYLLDEKAGGSFSFAEEMIDLVKSGKSIREAMILSAKVDLKNIDRDFLVYLNKANPSKNNRKAISSSSAMEGNEITEASKFELLANYFLALGKKKDAEELAKESLKANSDSNMALTILALIRAKEFKFDEAEKLAELAIAKEPGNYLTQFRYALVFSKRGMTEYGFVSGYTPDAAEKMREALRESMRAKSGVYRIIRIAFFC